MSCLEEKGDGKDIHYYAQNAALFFDLSWKIFFLNKSNVPKCLYLRHRMNILDNFCERLILSSGSQAENQNANEIKVAQYVYFEDLVI